ncbi:zeta toxin family protein [Bordetella sp. LUAb4]|uniref:zeta toxin family protein n=1 Tax=Bordetella sp. LUAb4 TaxID=2843195 RepID=UPI001E51B969|nr:zeta toxin family protein [Bordetella sp. LUAb4]
MVKKIIILAGPNGAGKTTFARSFLPHAAHCPRFVNADLIAAGLSPFNPEAAAIKAGRIMLGEIADLVARKESFSFETTLAGLSYAQRIAAWREAGYRVSLFFLTLRSADVAIERVARRVRQGGHDIPEAVIRRRFAAGLRNFEGHYRHIVNDWITFRTLKSGPQVISFGENP